MQENNFIILATPSPVSHRTAEENLGLGYLAATLRDGGYDVKILDGWLNDWSHEEFRLKVEENSKDAKVRFSNFKNIQGNYMIAEIEKNKKTVSK